MHVSISTEPASVLLGEQLPWGKVPLFYIDLMQTQNPLTLVSVRKLKPQLLWHLLCLQSGWEGPESWPVALLKGAFRKLNMRNRIMWEIWLEKLSPDLLSSCKLFLFYYENCEPWNVFTSLRANTGCEAPATVAARWILPKLKLPSWRYLLSSRPLALFAFREEFLCMLTLRALSVTPQIRIEHLLSVKCIPTKGTGRLHGARSHFL